MVQPSTNRRSKNLGVGQSMRLDISAGLQFMLDLKVVGSYASRGMGLPGTASRQQAKASSFMSLYRLSPEGVAQIISIPSHLRRFN